MPDRRCCFRSAAGWLATESASATKGHGPEVVVFDAHGVSSTDVRAGHVIHAGHVSAISPGRSESYTQAITSCSYARDLVYPMPGGFSPKRCQRLQRPQMRKERRRSFGSAVFFTSNRRPQALPGLSGTWLQRLRQVHDPGLTADFEKSTHNLVG